MDTGSFLRSSVAFCGSFCPDAVAENKTSGYRPDGEKSVQATATAVPTATPDPHAGKVQSSLNGSYVSPKTEAKRPFAIMINNIEYAFDHQMGVSKADVVYEALAEGGITRMMAVR